MKITKDMGFGTKAIHAGNKRNLYGSMGTPIVPAVTYEFDGTVILEDVSDRLEIDLAGEDMNATIGGFVFSHLERIPKVGDHVDFSGWRFSVLRMEGFRIVRVRAEKLAPSGKEESHDKED